MKKAERPIALMTAAQIICGLAIPFSISLTIPIAALPNYLLINHLGLTESSIVLDILIFLFFLRDLALGACLIFVEVEAIRICGRTKKASAFSTLNVSSLGRIVSALVIAGLLTLAFGDSIIPFLLAGLPAISPVVERLLLPFTLLTLALMVHAVQLLMQRAVTMQEETDLTI